MSLIFKFPSLCILKQYVACDNRLDSGLRRDRCGVCEGDSSKCKFVERNWNEKCPGFGKLSVKNSCSMSK